MISGYPHFRKPPYADFRLFKVWGSYLLSLWTANLFCGLHSPVIDQNAANLSCGFGVYSRAFPHEFPNMTITGLCWFISHFGWLLHVMCFQVLLGVQRFIILMHFFGPQPISWAQVRMLHGPPSHNGTPQPWAYQSLWKWKSIYWWSSYIRIYDSMIINYNAFHPIVGPSHLPFMSHKVTICWMGKQPICHGTHIVLTPKNWWHVPFYSPFMFHEATSFIRKDVIVDLPIKNCKWPIEIVDVPIKDGDFREHQVSWPEGHHGNHGDLTCFEIDRHPIYPQVTPFFLSQRLFNISKKSLPQSANIAMLRLREL